MQMRVSDFIIVLLTRWDLVRHFPVRLIALDATFSRIDGDGIPTAVNSSMVHNKGWAVALVVPPLIRATTKNIGSGYHEVSEIFECGVSMYCHFRCAFVCFFKSAGLRKRSGRYVRLVEWRL